MEPGAQLQLVFYWVTLQGIVVPYPRTNLLTVGIGTCDVFLESQAKIDGVKRTS